MSDITLTQSEEAIDVGGTAYDVLYKPNLSIEARTSIIENINATASSNDTDIFDMELVRDALAEGMLAVSEHDSNVLAAIKQDYIEV